ncbi:MAG: hypothetical protein WEB56_05395 [Roseovarius sp.]
MKQELYSKRNLEDLATEAVGQGRHVADRAKALHLGENAKDVAFVSRCFARLKERQPFDEADDGGFDAVMKIFDHSIASEYVGTESWPVETGFDEFGPQVEIRQMPVYSDRGNELIKLQNLFKAFRNNRDRVLDHMAANRCLLKIMSR